MENWEIGDITNPIEFMRFMLTETPEGSVWIVSTYDQTIINLLQPLASKPIVPKRKLFGFINRSVDVELPIYSHRRDSLIEILTKLDFGVDLIETHIYFGNETILESYDNFTCCWISKRIPLERLQQVNGNIGFSVSHNVAP